MKKQDIGKFCPEKVFPAVWRSFLPKGSPHFPFIKRPVFGMFATEPPDHSDGGRLLIRKWYETRLKRAPLWASLFREAGLFCVFQCHFVCKNLKIGVCAVALCGFEDGIDVIGVVCVNHTEEISVFGEFRRVYRIRESNGMSFLLGDFLLGDDGGCAAADQLPCAV